MDEDWPFAHARQTAVISLRQIIFDGDSILRVWHDKNDSAWQFLGLETPRVEDAVVVSLATIVAHDPTVAELADLPPGWHAWRKRPTDPWVREPNLRSSE